MYPGSKTSLQQPPSKIAHQMKPTSYPPGPFSLPLVGNLVELFRNPLNFYQKVAHDHGDIVYFKLGTLKTYFLNNPQYIQEVLVTQSGNVVKSPAWRRGKEVLGEGLLTSEGEYHRRQRRLAQPAFHRERLVSYASVMTSATIETQKEWQDSSIIDLTSEMYSLTLSIAARTLFGSEVTSESNEISDALTIIRDKWYRTLLLPMIPFYSFLRKLPIPTLIEFNQARDRLDATVYRLINERRNNPEDRHDLLSMLLLAQDDEGNGQGMTDVQVRDEVMTIFLAGHETTASSLIWTWYLLSQHPEVEEKLHSELASVLAGRFPTFEDVARLTYTRMIFAETLRLYPPIWLLTRQAIKDCKVDSYVITAGSLIHMCPFLVQRDPRHFPDPLSFNPDRWESTDADKRHKFAYFPFGGGARICIGEQFAWIEAILVIATIAQQWRLHFIPEQQVEPQPLVTLRPKEKILMKAERRNPA